MSRLGKFTSRFLRAQDGAVTVDFVVIVGVISTFGMVTVANLSPGIQSQANAISTTAMGASDIVKSGTGWFDSFGGTVATGSPYDVAVALMNQAKAALKIKQAARKKAKAAVKAAYAAYKAAPKSQKADALVTLNAARATFAAAKSSVKTAKADYSSAKKKVKSLTPSKSTKKESETKDTKSTGIIRVTPDLVVIML